MRNLIRSINRLINQSITRSVCKFIKRLRVLRGACYEYRHDHLKHCLLMSVCQLRLRVVPCIQLMLMSRSCADWAESYVSLGWSRRLGMQWYVSPGRSHHRDLQTVQSSVNCSGRSVGLDWSLDLPNPRPCLDCYNDIDEIFPSFTSNDGFCFPLICVIMFSLSHLLHNFQIF